MRLERIRGWLRVAVPLVGIVLLGIVLTSRRLVPAAQNHSRAGRRETTGSAVTGPKNSAQESDFVARCSAPGVIRCNGFDTPADIAGSRGDAKGTFPSNDDGSVPVIDTTQHASGTGSLMFRIKSRAGVDINGAFFTNFKDDFSGQIGEGQDVYVQWRQRFDTAALYKFHECDYTTPPPYVCGLGPDGGIKLINIASGDNPPCSPTNQTVCQNTCVEMESVLTTDQARYSSGNGPYYYNGCGFNTNLEFYDGVQVRMQHQGPPFCYYPNDPQRGCWSYTPNEWLTFQIHMQIGHWNQNDSRIQVWAARQGQPSTLIGDSVDKSGFTIVNHDPALKYGKVWFTIYHTNHDYTETYPVGHVWMDELIISTQKIADPRYGLFPPPKTTVKLGEARRREGR